MRTLHELPRFRDRWSYIYLEKGRMEVDGTGLKFYQKGHDGVVPIPIDQLAVGDARTRYDHHPRSSQGAGTE